MERENSYWTFTFMYKIRVQKYGYLKKQAETLGDISIKINVALYIEDFVLFSISI